MVRLALFFCVVICSGCIQSEFSKSKLINPEDVRLAFDSGCEAGIEKYRDLWLKAATLGDAEIDAADQQAMLSLALKLIECDHANEDKYYSYAERRISSKDSGIACMSFSVFGGARSKKATDILYMNVSHPSNFVSRCVVDAIQYQVVTLKYSDSSVDEYKYAKEKFDSFCAMKGGNASYVQSVCGRKPN
ncbi:MAG: hypothetical protein E6Q50_00645 [Lysobacter sp.]|nr:MAG: hypothetical protein E6Q50_00645 [Lysobacter sp.]